MSPTILREGGFRFFFFSREESRRHVHVASANGEAKYWLEPSIELAVSYGLSQRDLAKIKALVRKHDDVFQTAWQKHFQS